MKRFGMPKSLESHTMVALEFRTDNANAKDWIIKAQIIAAYILDFLRHRLEFRS